MGASPLESARGSLAVSVRRLLGGSGNPLHAFEPARPDDPGWFGPDSATWQVHSDIAILVGGIRALLLQTLHPLTMAGVADHSDYRHDALGRLHRTGAFLARTVYGTSSDAEAAVAQVRAIHERVQGIAPDGRRYSANSPHLLQWVHLTEVDSFLRAYQRYGAGQLPAGDADRYVAEMARVGLALGMTSAPMSTAELRDTIAAYRPELASGAQAREALRFLILPPLPLAARGPYALLFGAATGMLPGWARRMLRLPLAPGADPLVVRPAATAMLRVLGWALRSQPTAHRQAVDANA